MANKRYKPSIMFNHLRCELDKLQNDFLWTIDDTFTKINIYYNCNKICVISTVDNHIFGAFKIIFDVARGYHVPDNWMPYSPHLGVVMIDLPSGSATGICCCARQAIECVQDSILRIANKEKETMPDKNSSMMIEVSGENIIFRNFRGKPTQVTREGDRSFCLMISSRLIRDQLAARGCNIKKLKDKAIIDGEKLNDIEFVNVAVRVTPAENVKDDIWTALDMEQIDQASLEFTFYEYTINGRKGTRIYLKNARFLVKAFNNEHIEIDIRWPYDVTCKKVNKINAEETKMEKMTRAEVIGQLQMGITAFEMQEKETLKRDPIVAKLMLAMKNAIEYVGEVPKSETKVKTVTVKEPVFSLPEIKQVVFNYPATVVIWDDDVKTVVECQKGDNYSMEGGLAMCIAKRMMGNKSNFNKQIRKYTEDIKNVQTKKKAKEGTFEERKAARIALAEANKTTKGKSKTEKKKILDETRKGRSAPAVVNTDKMVVITEAYAECVRKKMIERGWDYSQTAKAAGIDQSTLSRWISPNVVSQKNKRMNRECFNKLNKALGIRWKIEE